MKRKILTASIIVVVAAVTPALAGSHTYKFLPDASSVVQTGGFAGVRETYSVTGRFRLTVSERTASFDWVDATLSEGPFLQDPNLGSLFNMTELVGTVVSETVIEFEGKTANEPAAEVRVTATIGRDSIHLKGTITSPCCDLFDYSLDAVAVKQPQVPPPPPGPVLKYVVASPRACLVGPPSWSSSAYYLPAGDAENFPRKNGSVRVPVGARVVFCLSRDLESVWYSGSYGTLGTSIVVQLCKACKCPEFDSTICASVKPDPNNPQARCVCENCLRLGAVCCPRPDDTAIEPCPWVTVGKDGGRDCRKGPSIGRARIGVPVHFRRPGVYLLRAIVHTFARPGYPLPLEDWRDRLLDPDDSTAAMPEIPGADDRDVIYIRVRVVNCLTDSVETDEIPTDDPDFRHIKPMPKDVDPNEPVDLESDLNGDDVVDLGDFAIMAQQWGKEYETPFNDDE